MDYIGGFHGGHQELDTTESLSLFWSENAGSQGNCLFYILRSYILLAPKWLLCECLSLIHVQLFAKPWTTARQTPLFMGFSRPEYWSG